MYIQIHMVSTFNSVINNIIHKATYLLHPFLTYTHIHIYTYTYVHTYICVHSDTYVRLYTSLLL
jgi:hypothetical protein